MIPRLVRAIVTAVVAALGGAAGLMVSYAIRPDVTLRLDRDLPPNATGFYPVERSAAGPFVWTSERAELDLPGFDRRAAWTCTVRLRGAREDPTTLPSVTLAVDGVVAVSTRSTNDFEPIEVDVPARGSQSGLRLSLASSSAFVPGPRDTRRLGVMIGGIGCRPATSALALPPAAAVRDAAVSAALIGAAAALTGVTAGAAMGAGVVTAVAQAVSLASGIAPYSALPGRAVWLAVWIAVALVGCVGVTEAITRRRLRNTARFVAVVSAAALYLKLIALLHPSKPLVDAVFHAHRLEWVLAGRFYFTQLSTSATPFPYAIGLYLFAAPWSLLTHDYVTLLRIVVCASDAAAGALLYVVIVRTWGDRLTGAVAVGLVNLLPVSYAVVGHANLTNAFGQSVGLVTMAAVTVWALDSRRLGQLIGLVLISTLAFISHVSTLAILSVTLALTAGFFRWLGGPTLRTPARSVVLATAIAMFLSVVLYWGHFGDVYQAQVARMRATTVTALASHRASGQAPGATEGAGALGPAAAHALGRSTLPIGSRVAAASVQTVSNIGWPILTLALVGLWQRWSSGGRDRLALVLAAWGVTCLAFVMMSVVIPTGLRYQQDAWEFIGRVEHATSPAAIVLAAHGATWAWRAGRALRIASGALMAAAVATGAAAWIGWLQ
jgi:hypothetical protein